MGKANGEIGKMPACESRTAVRTEKAEFIYLFFCFLLYFVWSTVKELNYGPDEGMRYLIPEYIFRTGLLPDGWDPELRNELWGFSYAFYPTFLGPLLSAACMKVVSLVTENAHALVIAARFPGVICGTGTVCLAFRIGKRMFGRRGTWIFAVGLSMVPQFVFLTSYVNHDMICIFGTALILLSWVSVYQDGWNRRNGLLLAAGIIVVALTYYNGYGWILCSMVLFAWSWIRNVRDRAQRHRLTGIGVMIGLIVLVGIGYFFIRNAVLYDGDFLGMRTLSESAEKYAVPEWKPGRRETPCSMGMSVPEMLVTREWTGTPWIVKLFVTFVGAFGFADVFLPLWAYGIYALLFAVMGIGLIFVFIRWKKEQKRISPQEREKTRVFYGLLGAVFLIPPVLCVYYSYAVDYQPQGRYCYPMILVFFLFGTKGILEIAGQRKISERNRNRMTFFLCMGLVLLTLYLTVYVYLPG